MQQIYLALCGAGHMGLRALCVFPQLRRVLRGQGIEVELFAVVDINPDTHRSIQSTLEALLVAPIAGSRPYLELEKCLTVFHTAPPGVPGPLLVYDASPTKEHSTNLGVCIEYRRVADIHYLGEKPLVIDRYEFRAVKNELSRAKELGLRVFTDFIETQSSLLSAAGSRLDAGFVPVAFSFWREGPGGLKKLLDPRARKGVQGGALLDKAVHDLSILHALLVAGGRRPADVRIEVQRAVLFPSDIDVLLPEAFRPKFTFMAAKGRPLDEPRQTIGGIDHEACDALVSFEVVLTTGAANDWRASFTTSWLGADSTTNEDLRGLGLDDRDFLGDVPVSLFGTSTHIPVSDSRFCLLEDATGDQLLLDFLYKDSADATTKLLQRGPAGEWQRIDFTVEDRHRDFEYNSLGQTLATVCHAIVGQDAPLARFIDEDATLWVHNVLTQVREEALAFVDAQEPAETARETLQHRLGEYLLRIQQELELRGIILDLDNTIFGTETAVPDLGPVATAFARCFDAPFERYRADILQQSPERIVSRLFAEGYQRPGKLEDEVKRIFQDAYASLAVVPDLADRLFPGFREFIKLLGARGVRIGLVTSGVWILQARKIHAAGIATLFHPVIIDDALAPLGKEHALEVIARKWELRPRNVLVLGDDAQSELEAAANLGMRAAHLRAKGAGSCDCDAMLHVSTYGELRAAVEPWLPSPGSARGS